MCVTSSSLAAVAAGITVAQVAVLAATAATSQVKLQAGEQQLNPLLPLRLVSRLP
jgi:hypothetical protein